MFGGVSKELGEVFGGMLEVFFYKTRNDYVQGKNVNI